MRTTTTTDRRTLVYYHCHPQARPDGHDAVTKASVARALADLLSMDWGGDYQPADRPGGPLYFVPSDTLTSPVEAEALGIRCDGDLFGGVVPHPFVATKLVTHPLVDPQAAAPAGWSAAYGEAVRDVVLPGWSVFTPEDARTAGVRLIAHGRLRLKEPDGVGGLGQQVLDNLDALDDWIASTDIDRLRRLGVVLECNLDHEVDTLSVGQVRAGRWLASYVGRQRLTCNHRGEEVYGGSTLTVVQGDFEALRALELPPEQVTAVEQALIYHRAAPRCYPGWVASRANYDIAQGRDAAGRWRSGVLEQSWRIGGASGAEIAALRAFRDDPSRQVVRTSTHEVYGDGPATVPPGAQVHYDGTDAQVGRLTKYAQVEAHDGHD